MTGRAGGNSQGPRDALPPGPSSPTPAPGAAPLRRVIRVINPLGLHFRVADRFSRLARQFSCAVTVWNGETRADGTSLMDLIMLVVLPDSEVVLEVDGPDAPKAVEPLAEILAAPDGEDYSI